MIDILYIENPKEKKLKNLYLNDYNYYYKNNIKMRYKMKKQYRNNLAIKKQFEITHPVPKMLYSSSNFYSHPSSETQMNLIKNDIVKTKENIDDIMNLVENFSINLDSENQSENNEENITVKDDFFITKPQEEVNKKLDSFEKDIAISKPLQTKTIIDPKSAEKIVDLNKNFKNSLFFQNFEKYKFSRTGLLYPKTLKKYELPEYKGNDKMEKEYFEYRKKRKYPELVYNNINSFNTQFNKELGRINNNYGKVKSRGRFVNNPILSKYMEIIPVYDIYKDLKAIENRYIDSKFKFKLLPLVNTRLRKLDKLADRVYKQQKLKNGLNNIIQINNFNKMKLNELKIKWNIKLYILFIIYKFILILCNYFLKFYLYNIIYLYINFYIKLLINI